MNVKQILFECGALLEGHFLLSSGNHSGEYFQCARLLQYPQKAALVLGVACTALKDAQQAGELNFDIAVGPAMGGIVVAYEVGRLLGIPAIFTERNEEGVMCLRRGFEIAKGCKVIITEDVITTGKSTLETARALEQAGAIVTASVCVVDRRPKGAANPFTWKIFAALRQSAVMYDAKECPLCKEGKIPVIKPGSRKML
jgi:orotate phosphoribosyltransferase